MNRSRSQPSTRAVGRDARRDARGEPHGPPDSACAREAFRSSLAHGRIDPLTLFEPLQQRDIRAWFARARDAETPCPLGFAGVGEEACNLPESDVSLQ